MKRTKAEQVKRYLIFLVGLFVNSLGVSLITKGNLGTSPISSIPYVLSLNFPFSLGNFTIVFSLLLIFLQFLLLGKNFKAEHLLQIPVSMAFGYFIDMSMILLICSSGVLYFKSPGTSDRLSGPWRWRIYGSAGRCSYASGRVFCKSRGIPHPF